jgi:hypothetical protein
MRRPAIPRIDEILARFILRQAESPDVEPSPELGEVVLFQAVGLYQPDPRTALREALEAAGLLLGPQAASMFQSGLKGPGEWAHLVRSIPPMMAVPFCLGNYPQLVHDLSPLMAAKSLKELAKSSEEALDVREIQDWGRLMLVNARLAEALLAAAALRLARQLDAAAALLAEVRRQAPVSWEPLLINEEAALAWHRGDTGHAAQLWSSHPHQDNPVVQFNRGLAFLFDDQTAEAKQLLAASAAALPEKSAWHHLARMYLALIEIL